MRTKAIKVSNGTLKIPQIVRTYMNLDEGETVVLRTNDDGSVTIKKKDSITSLKGILRLGKQYKMQMYGDRESTKPQK